MKKSSTCTRCAGRSSSSASSEPMTNSPAGISASSGNRSADIRRQENSAPALFDYTGAMKLETFALERLQSTWENRVAWNLSESGVQPLRLMDLAGTAALRGAVLAQDIGYPATNGTASRHAIARVAARTDAWIVSDEIYRGAERQADETPTMWGRSERVIVTSGLSKAYGLPGLRIGWVVAPPATIDALWSIHDYTTIAPGAINDRVAAMALTPGRRERLLARTRAIIRTNYPLVAGWAERHGLTHVPPEA